MKICKFFIFYFFVGIASCGKSEINKQVVVNNQFNILLSVFTPGPTNSNKDFRHLDFYLNTQASCPLKFVTSFEYPSQTLSSDGRILTIQFVKKRKNLNTATKKYTIVESDSSLGLVNLTATEVALINEKSFIIDFSKLQKLENLILIYDIFDINDTLASRDVWCGKRTFHFKVDRDADHIPVFSGEYVGLFSPTVVPPLRFEKP